MAVDLHLQVFSGPDRLIREYLRMVALEAEGHIWYTDSTQPGGGRVHSVEKSRQRLHRRLASTRRDASLWVGGVSWLKASLFNSEEKYVPAPVRETARLFQDLPVVTEKLVAEAHRAMKLPNTTTYGVADPDDVTSWLREHVGHRVGHESL